MSILRCWHRMLGITAAISALLLAGPGQGAADDLPVDLAIGVTADPSGTFARPVILTVTVTNNGPGTLVDAVAGTRPQLGEFPGYSLRPPNGCTRGQPPVLVITCRVGRLAPGASRQFPIEATGEFSGSFEPVPITFLLSDIHPTDPNPGNNSVTLTCVFVGFAARC